MTDPDLVAKKLAFVVTCLHELRTLARPDAIDSDVRERRFVEHTLQVAIQACQDVASHIVSDDPVSAPVGSRVSLTSHRLARRRRGSSRARVLVPVDGAQLGLRELRVRSRLDGDARLGHQRVVVREVVQREQA